MSPPDVSRSSGFTLLELLVVLLIVGVMMGMAALSVGSRDLEKVAREELDRLKVRIGLVVRESQLYGEEWGIRFHPNGYEFQILNDENHWLAPGADRLLQPHRFPDGFVSMELRVEGNLEDKPLQPEDPPQVIVSSDGTMTPFQWQLRLLGARGERIVHRLVAGVTGRVQIERVAGQ
ncbi:MAG: type II secretion system minor pseudopilin GspH [Magnetococcales bacterium]|nr:type II secretion system minor pseudopilin GspH [Magnetococcales bacterium]